VGSLLKTGADITPKPLCRVPAVSAYGGGQNLTNEPIPDTTVHQNGSETVQRFYLLSFHSTSPTVFGNITTKKKTSEVVSDFEGP